MRNCSEEDRSGGSEKSRGKRGYTAATTFVHIVCKSSNARIIHIADSGERTYVSRRFHARTPKQIASYIITRENVRELTPEASPRELLSSVATLSLGKIRLSLALILPGTRYSLIRV